MEFPSHRNLFVNTQLRRGFKTFALNATAAASRNPGQIDLLTGERGKVGGDVRGQLYLDTYPRTFLHEKTMTYATTVGVARQSFYGGSGLVRGALNSQTVATRLNTAPYKIARETTLSQSFSVGQTWLQGGRSVNGSSGVAVSGAAAGITLDGITQISRNVQKLGSVGLSYQYRQAPLPPGLGADFANPKHLVSLSSYMSGSMGSRKLPYQFQLLASRALDKPQSNLSAGTRFSLGGPWSGQIRFTHSSFATFAYQETEYAIVRRISGRDFAVYYSTLSKRFQLDLSGARF